MGYIMDESESAVMRTLQSWGFSVEKLPESSVAEEQTPDFKVIDPQSTYIVEVKTRGDDLAELEERNRILNLGEVFEARAIRLVPGNAESKIFRRAQHQLSIHQNPHLFRIVWLVTTGRAQEAKCLKLEANVYGLTDIVEIGSKDAALRRCYFFRNSEFYRYREVLDAAVICTPAEGKLCLNPLSSRLEAFRKSKLYTQFGDAVCDPMAEVARGDAFLIDSGIDRKDETAVIEYLKRMSGRPGLMKIDLAYQSASIRLPRES